MVEMLIAVLLTMIVAIVFLWLAVRRLERAREKHLTRLNNHEQWGRSQHKTVNNLEARARDFQEAINELRAEIDGHKERLRYTALELCPELQPEGEDDGDVYLEEGTYRKVG